MTRARHWFQVLTLSVTLHALVVHAVTPTEVESWGVGLGTAISNLTAGLGVAHLQTEYDSLSYNTITVSGSDLFTQISTSVTNKLQSRADAASVLRDDAVAAYLSSSFPPSTTGDCCDASGLSANSLFGGLEVSFDSACFRHVDPAVSASEVDVFASLQSTYEDNVAANPAIKWQYIGSDDTDLYSIYPSVRDGCENYVPFLRPWYVAAASSTKDLVIAVDISASMRADSGSSTRLDIAREAVKIVLNTLSPDDRVAIVAFNSFVTLASDCFATTLAEATPANIDTLSGFLDSLVPAGGTSYNAAFSAAFDYFEPTTTADDKIILFMTDGDASDAADAISTINTENADRSVKILTYAFSTDVTDTTLQTIADENGGQYTFVAESDNLVTAMGRYYSAVSSPDAAADPVWTVPYFDFSGLGVVTTVALPVIVSSTLRAVVGVDLTLADVLSDVAFFDQGSLSYAFLIDSRGRAIVHPRLPLPTSVDDAPSYFDISLLENAAGFSAVRDAMLRRETGSAPLTVSIARPRGDGVLEGVSPISTPVTYHYGPLGSTPFILCVVLADSDADAAVPVSIPQPDPQPYHRVDLTGAAECEHFARPATISRSTYYLAPSSFVDPDLATSVTPTADEVRDLEAAVNSATGDTSSLPDHLKLRDVSTVRNDVWATAALDTVWTDSSFDSVNQYAAWRYVCTPNGLFRTFPGHPSSSDFICSIRPWFRRSLIQPGINSISAPYEDTAGAGIVITLSQSVVPANGQNDVAGVLGMDFSLAKFQDLLNDNTGCAASDSVLCFVMDDSGFITFHPIFNNALEAPEDLSTFFIGDVYPVLATALDGAASISRSTCDDFDDKQTHTFYTMPLASSREFTTASGTCVAHISPVPDSNTYIVVLELDSGVDCPDEWAVGSSVVTRSTSPITYDQCTETYSPITGTPVCPLRSSVSAVVGISEAALGLGSCFAVNCEAFAFEGCRGTILCKSCIEAGTVDTFLTCKHPEDSCPTGSRDDAAGGRLNARPVVAALIAIIAIGLIMYGAHTWYTNRQLEEAPSAKGTVTSGAPAGAAPVGAPVGGTTGGYGGNTAAAPPVAAPATQPAPQQFGYTNYAYAHGGAAGAGTAGPAAPPQQHHYPPQQPYSQPQPQQGYPPQQYPPQQYRPQQYPAQPQPQPQPHHRAPGGY